jgi:ribonuclease-3
MRLGRTELRGGGHEKERILANVFEALVAALWLDAGLAPVLALTQRLFGVYLVAGSDPLAADPKTRFQEWCHSERAQTPRYAAVSDSGVENDAHRFVVEVRIAGEPYGRGEGRTKRAAERAAAESALAQLADESTTSPSRRSHDGHQPGGDAPRATSDCARE